MPHKHTRRKDDDNAENFNLPPSSFARPLPVTKGREATTPHTKSNQKRKPNKKRETTQRNGLDDNSYGVDDTPKAFARLMQFAKTGKGVSGLDDGTTTSRKTQKQKQKQKQKQTTAQNTTSATENASKKRKRGQEDSSNNLSEPTTSNTTTDQAAKQTTASDLKILPGESLRDFSVRVDRALPLTGLAKRGKRDPGSRMTKHEKHLRRLQAGWREEEARLREKEEEQREEEEEAAEEMREKYGEDVFLSSAPLNGVTGGDATGKKAGRKGAKRHDEDPWAVLKKKRDAPKGINDVVQAPPSFTKIPTEKIKAKGAGGRSKDFEAAMVATVRVANVPANAGSLMRREQLGEARKSVIEGYRKMMAERKAA